MLQQKSFKELIEENFIISAQPTNINFFNDSLIILIPDAVSFVIFNVNNGKIYKHISLKQFIDLSSLQLSSYTKNHMKGEFLNSDSIVLKKNIPLFNLHPKNLILTDSASETLIFQLTVLLPYKYQGIYNGESTNITVMNQEPYLAYYNLKNDICRLITVNMATEDKNNDMGNMANGFFFKQDTLVTNCIYLKSQNGHSMLQFVLNPATKQYDYSEPKLFFDFPQKKGVLNEFTYFSKPSVWHDTLFIKDYWGIYNSVTGRNIIHKIYNLKNMNEIINSYSFYENSLFYVTSSVKDSTKAIKQTSFFLNIYDFSKASFNKINLTSNNKIICAELYKNKLYSIESDEKRYFVSVSIINTL